MQKDVQEGLNPILDFVMNTVHTQGDSTSNGFKVDTNNIPFSVVEGFMCQFEGTGELATKKLCKCLLDIGVKDECDLSIISVWIG